VRSSVKGEERKDGLSFLTLPPWEKDPGLSISRGGEEKKDRAKRRLRREAVL